MPGAPIDALAGFRRRLRITPASDWVRSEVEDDFHHMDVVIRHEQGEAVEIEALMVRAPWTTCPGAVLKLQQTFTGVPLGAFAARGEKTANCTHLHDLAILAAAHAGDTASTVYDVFATEPMNGDYEVELRRNGEVLLHWRLDRFAITAPSELAGTPLEKLKPMALSADPAMQEAIRILRWAALMSHGRTIPLDQQSDASLYPGRCYTFQPDMAVHARRIGEVRDFSNGQAQPFDRAAAPRATLKTSPSKKAPA